MFRGIWMHFYAGPGGVSRCLVCAMKLNLLANCQLTPEKTRFLS